MKLTELKTRMQELEVRAKRSLGQNFLVSDTVIGRIISAARAAEPNALVEIGPGLGSLTEHLADFKPLLIELDRDIAAHWRERDFQVIEADALKVDWNQLSLPAGSWLVSNLPYNISTHLVVDRCFGPASLTGMILMFQKEVAQRLMAAPRSPNYGLLSVITQNFWEMAKVVDAAPRDFHPAPRVASRVLRFTRKPAADLDSGFLSFVKVAFHHRRKFLLKNLAAWGHKDGLDWPPLFEELSIGLKARPEELTTVQFAELYRRWKAQ